MTASTQGEDGLMASTDDTDKLAESSPCRPGEPDQTLDEDEQRFSQLDATLDYGRSAPVDATPPGCDVTTLSADAGQQPRAPRQENVRYSPLSFHAAGNLGEIHKAQDSELGRMVALKRIKPSHRDNPDDRQRFLREAEITGGLEHPGVVPVYGLLQDASGAPCYAMRFIEGETLATAIHRFHEAVERNPFSSRKQVSAGERSLALRELLGRFLAVCQTMAYAHDRGIVHRDLKPDNIMLGKYGETLVVDWGLARSFRHGEPEKAGNKQPSPPTPLSAGAIVSQPGQLIGTPLYMSPEQAAGEPAHPASDIYSLGAILYQLLAGHSAIEPGEVFDVLERVVRGRIRPLRHRKPAVPRALEAICAKAMALTPEARYATATELAADVERWLDDQPVQGYREPVLARLARWSRHHQRLVAGLAGLLLASVALGGGGGWWYQQRRAAHQAETDRGVTSALTEVRTLLQQGEVQRQDAEQWLATARLAEKALERAEELLATGAGSHDLAAQVEELRQAVRQDLRDSGLHVEVDRIRLESAAVRPGQGRYDAAGAALRYAEVLQAYGLDLTQPNQAAARVRQSRLDEVLRAALVDWRRAASEPAQKAQVGAVLRALQEGADPWWQQWRAVVERQDKEGARRLAIEAETRQLAAVTWVNLARDLVQLEEKEAAARLLRAAQVAYPGDFWINHELGRVLLALRPPQTADAVRYLTAALALRPHSPGVWNNLGATLSELGDGAGTIRCFRRAIELDPHYAQAHYNLGNALAAQGDLPEAIHSFHRAIDLAPKAAPSWSNLGTALQAHGDLAEAIRCFRRAIELDSNIAAVHYNLGNALKAQGDLTEAIRCYRQAIALDPKDAQAYTNLGAALFARNDVAGAIRCYRRALELDSKLAPAHYNLGAALAAKGEKLAALRCYRRALELDPKNAQTYFSLGAALEEQGDVTEAMRCYRQAITLDPKDAKAYTNLAAALFERGDVDEAIRCLQQAVGADPKNTKALNNLGTICKARGDVAGAVRYFRQALAIDSHYPMAHYNLGVALQAQGNLAEAIRCFRRAIELDPRYARAYGALGEAFLAQGSFAEARKATMRCLELLPISDPLRIFAANQLRRGEAMLSLEARWPDLVQGKAQPKDAADALALAQFCQTYKQRYLRAARLFKDAFTAEPKLADDLRTQVRYNAACAAALASAGQGEDASSLEDRERTRWRQQAQSWLAADLTAWRKVLDQGAPAARAAVAKTLQHWQGDSDFASVRGGGLEMLPEAERSAWQKVWTEVEALRQRADRRP
jgi:tetratricopeptide (TPR) repeat protein/tRNA A-37 threonylcarbamoyl transferase component Bud32